MAQKLLWVAITGTILFVMALSIRPAEVVAPAIVAGLPYEEARVAAVRDAARRFGVDTILAVQVSRQENYRGLPTAWSSSGCCVGIMQVHMNWYGRFHEECGGSDLLTMQDNACYGVLILRDAIRMCEGETKCALRVYYLGPKGRWSTLKGDEYAAWVLSRAGE